MMCGHVLEGLSDDQAMQVLSSAPGSFEGQLIQLPRSVRPVAALAHCSGLASVCSPATFNPCASSELPVLTLCVETSQAQADMSIVPEDIDNDPQPSLASECAAAPIWPAAADLIQAILNSDLFSLEQRTGCTSCCLLLRHAQSRI